jgi:hypothetical protein
LLFLELSTSNVQSCCSTAKIGATCRPEVRDPAIFKIERPQTSPDSACRYQSPVQVFGLIPKKLRHEFLGCTQLAIAQVNLLGSSAFGGRERPD